MLRKDYLRRSIFLLMALFLTSSGFAAPPRIKSGYFKTSDRVQLHYLEAGHGQGMLFVPGWSMPAWIWQAQIQHFAEHYHVVALDPRSQGDSQKVSEGNYPGRRAKDIAELLDHLKLGPAVLVGWSLGVPELLTYAEQFGGHNVRAYVLVDGFAWDKLDPQFVSAMLATYGKLEMDRRDFTDKLVRSMYKKPQAEDYIQRVMAASLRMPADSAITASVSSISRADWRPAISKLDRPVLIACETAMKPTAADLIKSMVPSARVELFDDAGHAIFVDDADRFNSILDDFLQHLSPE
jgi:microsomal epoxide hydrolase